MPQQSRDPQTGRFGPSTHGQMDFVSGDPCPRCGGWLGIIRSIVWITADGPQRRRYIRCTVRRCGWKPTAPNLLPAPGHAPCAQATRESPLSKNQSARRSQPRDDGDS